MKLFYKYPIIMTTIVNKSDITATTVEEVIDQVVELIQAYGVDAAREDVTAYECKEGFGEGEYTSSVEQVLYVLGEMNGDWQTSIKVTIFENRSIGGGDYLYTVTASEF